MIRTVVTIARSMMIDADAPERFWAEAINTAVYIHRRTPTTSLDQNATPYEKLYGKKADLTHMKKFGCLAFKHIPKVHRSGKFGTRSQGCVFLGYVHDSATIYRLWDFDNGPRGKQIEASNVIFVEKKNAWTERNAGEKVHDITKLLAAFDNIIAKIDKKTCLDENTKLGAELY